MSRGLNYSGFKLPYNNSSYRAKGSKGGVHIRDDKHNYWYRVSELGKFIEGHLGSPEFDKTLTNVGVGQNKEEPTATDWVKLRGLKGIIMFKVSGWGNATGHFTLWDGNNLIYPGGAQHDDPSSEYYYFHMKYEQNGKVIQTNEIKLWELK